jgi:hypothetical protein
MERHVLEAMSELFDRIAIALRLLNFPRSG